MGSDYRRGKTGRSIFRSIEENWKRCVERGDSWTLGINLCGATLLERAWPWACCWGQWDGPHGETLYSRRVPCKTVLEVNDNSGRRIPDRLTFELKELRLKLYSFDSSTASSVPFLLIPPLSLSLSFSLPSLFAPLSSLLLFLFPPPLSSFVPFAFLAFFFLSFFAPSLEKVSSAVGSMTRTHRRILHYRGAHFD